MRVMMKKLLLLLALAPALANAQSYDTAGRLKTGENIQTILGAARGATNYLPQRLTNGTSFIVPVLDTTLTARWPAGSTPADNESNSVTTTRVGTFTYVFDGSAWDRWTGV